MDCCKVVEKLSCYLDGALDEHTMEMLESHVASCASCQRELASLRTMVIAAGEIEQVQPPTHLRDRIMLAVRDSRQHARRCAQVSGLLTAYVDGEVSAGEGVLVAAHLCECEDCAAEVVQLRKLVAASQTIEPVDPPADLRSRIAAAVAAEPVPSASVFSRLAGLIPQRSLKWAGGAVAAGVIALTIVVSNPSAHNAGVKPHAPRATQPAPVVSAEAPSSSAEPTVTVAPAPEAEPAHAASGPVRKHTVKRPTREPERVAILPSPKPLPKPVVKHPAKHEPAVAEQPDPEPTTAVTAEDTAPPTEVASVPAAPVETASAAKPTEPPATVKVAMSSLTEDARAWVKQMKEEAVMRRGQGKGSGFQIITSRF